MYTVYGVRVTRRLEKQMVRGFGAFRLWVEVSIETDSLSRFIDNTIDTDGN